MIPKTRMTIEMYLRQAGLKTDAPARPKQFIPLKCNADNRFGEVLNRVASTEIQTSGNPASGATLADYLRQRHSVASSAFFSLSKRHSTAPDRLIQDRFGGLPPYASMQKQAASTAVATERATVENASRQPSGADDSTAIRQGIRRAARKFNLPEKLIQSVIQAESNFRADAVSPAGAQGLMQLMPATARELGVTDPFDVQQNIDGGAKYLRQMLDRFGGDLKVALAAYNAGLGTVQKYDGDVPYRETRSYVRKVLAGMGATNLSQA